MSCHQCSIMLVQLQGYIIADIQIHYNIILMYDDNVYQGISFPPQFLDGDGRYDGKQKNRSRRVDVASQVSIG